MNRATNRTEMDHFLSDQAMRVVYTMLARGLTKTEVARRAGATSNATVNWWLRGTKTPGPEASRNILRAVGVPC